MRKHLQFRRLFIALFAMLSISTTQAIVVPYLPPLQSFGGTSVDVATIALSTGDYTLEVQGTAGTLITVAGGIYTYTPTTTSTIRFSQKSGKVYVYEGSVYKATITTDFTKVTYPDIFGETNNATSKTGIYDIKNLLLLTSISCIRMG